jgi:hypothetical protein
MTLAADIARQHWAAALDASREAVLVVVGWAAVTIVLFADRSSAKATTQPAGDGSGEIDPSLTEPPADTESVVQAQWRVHRLRARLAELAAARERAGSAADPDLDREVASTSARLEHARQWLTSAQSALALSRHEKREVGRPAGGLAPLVAEQAADHQREQPVLLVRIGRRRFGRHDEAVRQPEDVDCLHALACLAGLLGPP